jgi:hypothetical protein
MHFYCALIGLENIMPNLLKTPKELLLEEAGLPSYAEGHSVSPEQMRVELMINGHKVHQADLPHDHPLIQHFAGGAAVHPAPSMPEGMFDKIKKYAPSLLGHGLVFGLPAYDVIEKTRAGDTGGARESFVDAITGLMPLPVQAGLAAMHSTELNPDEEEQLRALWAQHGYK